MGNNLSKIKLFGFVGMTFALVFSIHNVPDVAATGWVMFFYLILAAFTYALPITLIAGEFASIFTKTIGGPEVWIENSINKKWGFVTSWLLWVQMCPGMVMISAALAAALGNAFGTNDLSQNNVVVVVCILVSYWIITILNLFFDMAKIGGRFGSVLGIYIPFALMLVLGVAAMIKTGFNSNSILGTQFSWDMLLPHKNFTLFPSADATETSSLQYFAPILFIYSGIEMSSVYITRLIKPVKTYLRGIFMVVVFMFGLNAINGFLVANIVENGQIELNNVTQSIILFCDVLGLPHWIVNIFALSILISVLVQVSAWASGPSKTITESARLGQYPPKWKYWKTNRYNISPAVLLTQAVIISLLSLTFLMGTAVNHVFLMLANATTILYCIVYVILGVGIIKHRKANPNMVRPFKVGGQKAKSNTFLYFNVILLFATIFVGVVLTLITSSVINFVIVAIITLVLFIAPLVIARKQNDVWIQEVNKLVEDD